MPEQLQVLQLDNTDLTLLTALDGQLDRVRES